MGNPYLGSEILDLAGLPLGRHFVGYIYGGLECQEENIFFSSTGVESWASNKIFKVYLENQHSSLLAEDGQGAALKAWHDPGREMVLLRFRNPGGEIVRVSLGDSQGRVLVQSQGGAGGEIMSMSTKGIKAGKYFVGLEIGNEGFSVGVDLQ